MRTRSMRWARSLVGWLALATLSSALAHAETPKPADPNTPIPTKQTAFSIPFKLEGNQDVIQVPIEVQLHVSDDQGATWKLHDRVTPEAGRFAFRAPKDGEYWFMVRTRDRAGKLRPEGPAAPELRVLVDATPPTLSLKAERGATGDIVLRWQAGDAHLRPESLKISYQSPGEGDVWHDVAVESPKPTAASDTSGETTCWPKATSGSLTFRAEVCDRTDNRVRATAVIETTPDRVVQANPPPYQPISPPGTGLSNEPPPPFTANAAKPGTDAAGSSLEGRIPSMAKAWPGEVATQSPLTTAPADTSTPPANTALANTLPPNNTALSNNTVSPTNTLPAPTAVSPGMPVAPGMTVPPQPTTAFANHDLTPPSTTAELPPPTAATPKVPRTAPITNVASNNNIPSNNAVPNNVANNSVLPPWGLNTASTSAPSAAEERVITPPAMPSPPSSTPLVVSRPNLPTAVATPTLPLPAPATNTLPPQPASTMLPAAAATVTPTAPAGELPPPGVRPRMLNSRRFELEYNIETGTTGIGKVELWGTRDGGTTWFSYGADPDNRSPFIANLDRDGLYGFRMVVLADAGASAAAPRSGEQPDIWVGVDTTPPTAELSIEPTHPDTKPGDIAIRWQAKDEQLTERPISLLFAETTAGTWSTIASGLENTGRYVWHPGNRLPEKIFIRLTVRDEAGNERTVDMQQPVTIERVKPQGKILDVRPVKEPTAQATSVKAVK